MKKLKTKKSEAKQTESTAPPRLAYKVNGIEIPPCLLFDRMYGSWSDSYLEERKRKPAVLYVDAPTNCFQRLSCFLTAISRVIEYYTTENDYFALDGVVINQYELDELQAICEFQLNNYVRAEKAEIKKEKERNIMIEENAINVLYLCDLITRTSVPIDTNKPFKKKFMFKSPEFMHFFFHAACEVLENLIDYRFFTDEFPITPAAAKILVGKLDSKNKGAIWLDLQQDADANSLTKWKQSTNKKEN